MLTIFAVSDGTGDTVGRVVRSALVQFPTAEVQVIRRGEIRTADQIAELVDEAAERKALILHSLVSFALRSFMLFVCRQRNVDAMDVMGPVLDRLSIHLHQSPREQAGIFRQLDEPQTRAIEAVEFAFRHDDGQNPDGLSRAEVILVGISRAAKTPLMLYLAYRGWFAANVPLLPEIPPPPPLLRINPNRVFCLVPSVTRLQETRRARAQIHHIPEEPYASLTRIQYEMQYAERLCTVQGWRKIEAAGRSVEEMAQEVITLLSPK